MKRVFTGVAVGAMALGFLPLLNVTTASADSTTTTTTTTTLAPPVQGSAPLPLALNVDTVVGSGGTGALKAPVGCAQTNEFLIGQTVVFRLSGLDVATGGVALTPKNVSSVVVTIPGVATPLVMAYGNHGAVAFWSVGWNTVGYTTTGIVNFKIVVHTIAVPAVTKRVATRIKQSNGKFVTRMRTRIVTKAVAGVSGTYTQAGYAAPSDLTMNPAPAG
ncbi:MAG TPA: hypothetical protein VGZ04_05425 [Acidimicrobiales bacterium]|nr:hypothetical protein [Acidimicrobiales bacterium]